MTKAGFDSPIGPLTVQVEDDAVVAVTWSPGPRPRPGTLAAEAVRQLEEYFAGRRRAFELPLRPAGTGFRLRVWRAMAAIPFGATASYADLARELDSAPRAIGGACAANPMPIVIPCHRVVAAGGRLGGYSGGDGMATKRFILALEASARAGRPNA